jgi:hypothetical protein
MRPVQKEGTLARGSDCDTLLPSAMGVAVPRSNGPMRKMASGNALTCAEEIGNILYYNIV